MAQKKRSSWLKLQPEDGCLVVHGDGTLRLVLPQLDDGEVFSKNHTLMLGFGLALSLQDERMIDMIATIMNEKHAESKSMRAAAQARGEMEQQPGFWQRLFGAAK